MSISRIKLENERILNSIQFLQEERERTFSKRKDDKLMKEINGLWARYKNNEACIEQLERAGA